MRMTEMSPRRGRINCPRASSTINSATVAIAERIATAHNGETLATSVLVTISPTLPCWPVLGMFSPLSAG